MNIITISKVTMLGELGISVYPNSHDLFNQFVYREAAGVYWNDKLNCFYFTVSKDWANEWDYKKCYAHLISVVSSGLGIRLRLSPDTVFDPDNLRFKEDIVASDCEIQKWIDENTKTEPN